MSERYVPDVTVPASVQKEPPRSSLRWIGKSMKRVEDPTILTGKGIYVDDIALPNMAHAAVLRSPYAHARIKSIDTTRAKALPGVIAVVTGAEFAETVGPTLALSCPPIEQRVIAIGKVRHVGEAIAAVVAESRYIAEDAFDLIDVEFEELPVVADPEQAASARGDAVLHPSLGDTNVISDRTYAFGPVDEDFSRADVIVKRRLRWHRSSAQPIETAGAVADYNVGSERFTIYCNTSMYNQISRSTCAGSLGVAVTQVNMIPSLVGGSFGSKWSTHKVFLLAAGLARISGRPVKFMEDRLDQMSNGDNHGADRVYEADLALKRDGTMLSLRFTVTEDWGAYMQYGITTHGNSLAQVVGPYRINSVGARIISAVTNKNQQGALRGMGSEVSNFVIERMTDVAARELDLDPVEIRRRNLIRADEFPYVIPTGNVYDSGNYQAVLQMALDMFDYEGWRAKQKAARAEGRHIGIGLVSCQERSVFSPTEMWSLNDPTQPGFHMTSLPETVRLRIDPSGKVFLQLNAPFWGNSPATVATQVLAESLTVEPSDILVTFADSDNGSQTSAGPAGSRYTTMVSGAIVNAVAIVREKLFLFAAHALGCAVEELELRDAKVGVKGNPDIEISFAQISTAAHYFRLDFPPGPEYMSGLEAVGVYDHPLSAKPADDRSHLGIYYPIMGHMVHAVAIEVDPNTGKVSFLDYVAVHDSGTVVNPLTMDGQIYGGTAHGIGTALLERFHYDENGQLLTASFADYHMPMAQDMPREIRIGHVETPSPYTEYGMKGGGESGRMAAPPAIVQAIEDALQPFGVEFFEVPLTPNRVRKVLRDAQKNPD